MSVPGSLRGLLAPLTPLYRIALAARAWRLATGREPVRRLRFPVISIGNLSTGGSGKTPLAIALAQALSDRGLQVDVLSRGYGRESREPARVLPDGTAEEFGDEPLLIARATSVPVYVAPQRYDAGLLAEADAGINAMRGTGFSPCVAEPSAPEGRLVHLLDDGFQHRQLHRDVNLLLFSHEDWRDRLLPAGNLREPLSAIRRADVIVIPAEEADLDAELRAWGWQRPIWRLHRRMEAPSAAGPVVAFCGIARPKQFFAGLEKAGLQLAERLAFPDHYRYKPADLQRLDAVAQSTGASALVTTEKDAVRLGRVETRLPILTADLRVEIEDQAGAIDWLLARLRDRTCYSTV